MKASKKINAAIKYAYRFILSYPYHQNAQMAFIYAMSPADEQKPDIKKPQAVEPGVAVRIRFRDEGEGKWFVLEA